MIGNSRLDQCRIDNSEQTPEFQGSRRIDRPRFANSICSWKTKPGPCARNASRAESFPLRQRHRLRSFGFGGGFQKNSNCYFAQKPYYCECFTQANWYRFRFLDGSNTRVWRKFKWKINQKTYSLPFGSHNLGQNAAGLGVHHQRRRSCHGYRCSPHLRSLGAKRFSTALETWWNNCPIRFFNQVCF